MNSLNPASELPKSKVKELLEYSLAGILSSFS